MKVLRALLLACALMPTVSLHAATAMEDAVLRFVRERTAAIAGRVEIQVDAPDARVRPIACESFEPFLPSGSRLWGRTTVGLRCAGAGSASMFFPVRIRIYGPALVAARALAPGQILAAEDLRLEENEITQSGMLTNPQQAIGRQIAVGVNGGYPLRAELLRSQQVIAQGETVKVQVAGAGFAIIAEGTAAAHATDGQSVQVRMESGRTVTGTARAGRLVEVRF
jgi:flagellar basal body P-ring formation protein FlgA